MLIDRHERGAVRHCQLGRREIHDGTLYSQALRRHRRRPATSNERPRICSGARRRTLPLNTMAQTLGYDVVEVSKGRAVAAAEPHAGHLNPAGTVHGGLAATLLDTCMGLAIRSMLDKGFAQTTLDFKISLVRPITPQIGRVKAEGKVITCGRRVGTAEGTLTDKDGRVLAHGTTTCLIFEQ